MTGDRLAGSLRKPGPRLLASPGGAPLQPHDLALLGLLASHDGSSPESIVSIPGCTARAEDPDPNSFASMHLPDGFALLAGYLNEPEALAATLGLPPATPALALLLAAHDRFGAETARHALGDWTLLRWHVPRRELTLATSETLRDCLFVAAAQGMVAVAPSCLELGRIPWVGRALDPQGLALNTSKSGLRQIRTDETIWRGIRLLTPGTLERFSGNGSGSGPGNGPGMAHTVRRMGPPPPPAPWLGSFNELVEEFDRIGRRVVRQHLTRHPRTAFQISGGLDSTLISAWGALERDAASDIWALTSVAPPGSGLPDELEWSAPAAAQLGLRLQHVSPGDSGNLFRPDPAYFLAVEAPVLGAFLTTGALDRAAQVAGASAVLGGWGGEMHVSNGFLVPETRSALRIWAAGVRDRLVDRRARGGWPGAAFGIRYAPGWLAALPAHWQRVWRKGPPALRYRPGSADPIGRSPMADKAAAVGTASPNGLLRVIAPYYDRRLVNLGARIPAGFLLHDGLTRPLARALLRGRVPDAVRLRTQGRVFSPDFVPRLRLEAAEARTRIPLFAEAGAGQYLDLPWLENALRELQASSGPADYPLYYSVQATAVMGEFLLWAAAQGVQL